MILAAVEDLLFSSKIRGVARESGVEVRFVREPGDIIEQARLLRPALIIFDLDNERLQPLETIMTLKSDAGLRSIRTVAFVSHVHAGLIAAARSAGASEVLARSAFVTRLAEIIETGRREQ